MFGTNDPYSASTELPDLISFLDSRFAEDQLPGDTFKSFATRYLAEHRPSEVFAVDNNYGILLTNGQRVKLCPDPEGEVTQQTGDMANPGTEIDITRRN